MQKIKLIKRLSLPTLFLLMFIPYSASAIGQITKPIVVDNAAKGQAVEEELIIINSEEEESMIALQADGDIAEWTRFVSPDNDGENINEISVPARSNMNIKAVIEIPVDIPNGRYRGSLDILRAAEKSGEENDSIANLTQKISRQVDITVTDEESIKAEVSVIPADYDISAGSALSLKVNYYNQGNVSIEPEVKVSVLQNGENLFNTSFPYPSDQEGVKPLESKETGPFLVAVNNLEPGKYALKTEVVYKNKVLKSDSFSFGISEGQFLAAGANYAKYIVIAFFAAAVVYLGYRLTALNGKKGKEARA